jgi:hypothetical protein
VMINAIPIRMTRRNTPKNQANLAELVIVFIR